MGVAEQLYAVLLANYEKIEATGGDGPAVVEELKKVFAFALPDPTDEFIEAATKEFTDADKDGNGSLSFDEAMPLIIALAESLGDETTFKGSKEECIAAARESFDEVDEDKSGTIDGEE